MYPRVKRQAAQAAGRGTRGTRFFCARPGGANEPHRPGRNRGLLPPLPGRVKRELSPWVALRTASGGLRSTHVYRPLPLRGNRPRGEHCAHRQAARRTAMLPAVTLRHSPSTPRCRRAASSRGIICSQFHCQHRFPLPPVLAAASILSYICRCFRAAAIPSCASALHGHAQGLGDAVEVFDGVIADNHPAAVLGPARPDGDPGSHRL